MGIAHEADTDRQPVGIVEVFAHKTIGAHIVGNFLDIVRIADIEASFLVEQVSQGSLSTLHLRRQQGFFANRAVQHPVDRRHKPRHARQAGKGQFRCAVLRLECIG